MGQPRRRRARPVSAGRGGAGRGTERPAAGRPAAEVVPAGRALRSPPPLSGRAPPPSRPPPLAPWPRPAGARGRGGGRGRGRLPAASGLAPTAAARRGRGSGSGGSRRPAGAPLLCSSEAAAPARPPPGPLRQLPAARRPGRLPSAGAWRSPRAVCLRVSRGGAFRARSSADTAAAAAPCGAWAWRW